MTHVHFIGIGGSGLSAIARLLLESGYTVSGSDRELSSFADEVRKAGATVYVGHHPRNLTNADWVVKSSAIADDNPEVQAYCDEVKPHPLLEVMALRGDRSGPGRPSVDAPAAPAQEEASLLDVPNAWQVIVESARGR